MSDPTEKQIGFAKKLGIEEPQNYTKEALSKLIDEKANKTKAPAPLPQEKLNVSHEKIQPQSEYRWDPGKDKAVKAMFISYAKDLCVAGKIETKQIRAYTQEFLNIYNEL